MSSCQHVCHSPAADVCFMAAVLWILEESFRSAEQTSGEDEEERICETLTAKSRSIPPVHGSYSTCSHSGVNPGHVGLVAVLCEKPVWDYR